MGGSKLWIRSLILGSRGKGSRECSEGRVSLSLSTGTESHCRKAEPLSRFWGQVREVAETPNHSIFRKESQLTPRRRLLPGGNTVVGGTEGEGRAEKRHKPRRLNLGKPEFPTLKQSRVSRFTVDPAATSAHMLSTSAQIQQATEILK